MVHNNVIIPQARDRLYSKTLRPLDRHDPTRPEGSLATDLDRSGLAGEIYKAARLSYNAELDAWHKQGRSTIIPEWKAILWLDEI